MDLTMSMTDIPIEAGIQILVPPGTSLAQNEFSATADFDVTRTAGALTPAVPGQIEGILLIGYAGIGQAPTQEGWIFFFDEDPNTTCGDATLTAAIRRTALGMVHFFPADWDTAGDNSSAYRPVEVPFHAVDTLYAVFRNLGADINDLVKDTEVLAINIWYRRDD